MDPRNRESTSTTDQDHTQASNTLGTFKTISSHPTLHRLTDSYKILRATIHSLALRSTPLSLVGNQSVGPVTTSSRADVQKAGYSHVSQTLPSTILLRTTRIPQDGEYSTEHTRIIELIYIPQPLSRCSLTLRYVYQPKARYRSRKLTSCNVRSSRKS